MRKLKRKRNDYTSTEWNHLAETGQVTEDDLVRRKVKELINILCDKCGAHMSEFPYPRKREILGTQEVEIHCEVCPLSTWRRVANGN